MSDFLDHCLGPMGLKSAVTPMKHNQAVPNVGAVAEVLSGVPWFAERLMRIPCWTAARCQQERHRCAWLVHSKSAHEDSQSRIFKVDHMWPAF